MGSLRQGSGQAGVPFDKLRPGRCRKPFSGGTRSVASVRDYDDSSLVIAQVERGA